MPEIHVDDPRAPGFNDRFADFLESITDEPPLAADYIGYAISAVDQQIAYFKEKFPKWWEDEPGRPGMASTAACVISNLEMCLSHFERLKRRMDRER